MKFNIRIVIILFLVAFISCNPNSEYHLEEKLLNCIKKENGNDKVSQILQIKEVLLRGQYLNGDKGIHFANFLNRILQDNNILNDEKLIKDVNEISKDGLNSFNCIQYKKYTSEEDYNTSKVFKVFRDIANIKELNINNLLVKPFLNNLETDDLNHEFYQVLFCYSFSKIMATQQFNNASNNFTDELKTYSATTAIVLIDSENVIYFNKDQVKLNELKDICKKYLLANTKPYHFELIDLQERCTVQILLEQRSKVPYEYYKSVYESIQSAYQEIWEEKSQTFFRTSYSDLDKKRQAIISKMFAFNIVEN